MLKHYQNILQNLVGSNPIKDYLNDPLLLRLRKVGYFCGMDYASKSIYNFSEYISRFDHSLNVALITYYLTQDQTMTLAGLYHDVATPCFSHVIDYMNKDYLNQESTEDKTSELMLQDIYLTSLLNRSGIKIEDIIDFKKYSIVDNNRPKVCADRLDAVILNSIGWTKSISKEQIKKIINNIYVGINESNEQEISFRTLDVARMVKLFNDEVNKEMHSSYDLYMMQLLADITKNAIDKGLITYDDLYTKTEDEIIQMLIETKDISILTKMQEFLNISKDAIPTFKLEVKNRILSPLVGNKRI